MSVPNGDKPAFPPNGGWRDNDPLARGLSKREHFAAMAMQGILANPDCLSWRGDTARVVAARAIECADALIEALEGQS